MRRKKRPPVSEEAPKVTYAGISIEYDERENKWRFTKNGRERSCDTLQAAKEAILRKDPVLDKVKFTPVEAYMRERGYGSAEYTTVRVTSIAEKGWRADQEVWVVHKDGHRSKEIVKDVFEVSDANKSKIADITKLRKQANSMLAHADRLHLLLKQIKLPTDGESNG